MVDLVGFSWGRGDREGDGGGVFGGEGGGVDDGSGSFVVIRVGFDGSLRVVYLVGGGVRNLGWMVGWRRSWVLFGVYFVVLWIVFCVVVFCVVVVLIVRRGDEEWEGWL